MLLSFSMESGWCESCEQYTRARICKKFGDRFKSREAALKIRMGRAWGEHGEGKKLTFAVLIETPPNSNTICGHALGVSHFNLRGIGPVVMENERKNAWGGLSIALPMRISGITLAFFDGSLSNFHR